MNKPEKRPIHPADALFTVHVPREPNAAMTELCILKPCSGMAKGEVVLAASGNRLGKSMLLHELQRDLNVHAVSQRGAAATAEYIALPVGESPKTVAD